jgi:hypothetical protein
MKKKDSAKRVSSWQKKYEELVSVAKKFVADIQQRKTTMPIFYTASDQPKAIVPGAPHQQFNVLEVRHLITQVLTADSLGYQTMLTTQGDKLIITFSEKYPFIPLNLQYLP